MAFLCRPRTRVGTSEPAVPALDLQKLPPRSVRAGWSHSYRVGGQWATEDQRAVVRRGTIKLRLSPRLRWFFNALASNKHPRQLLKIVREHELKTQTSHGGLNHPASAIATTCFREDCWQKLMPIHIHLFNHLIGRKTPS